MSDSVLTEHPKYAEMKLEWRIPDLMRGGTLVCRHFFEELVPQEPKEDANVYNQRKTRAFLVPGYKEAIPRLASKPYKRPVKIIGGELTGVMSGMIENVDGSGKSLDQMARQNFQSGIHRGVAGFLVDLSPNPGENERDQQRHPPRIMHIDAVQVFAWSFLPIDGGEILEHLRIKETKDVRVSEFDVAEQTIVHQYDLQVADGDGTAEKAVVWYTRHHRFERPDGHGRIPSFIREDPVRLRNINRIPYHPWGTDQDQPMMIGRPALGDLAHVNHRHYQNYSGYSWKLRWAGVHQIAITGVRPEDVEDLTVAAVDKIIPINDPGAEATVLETTGKPAELLRTDLQDDYALMEVLGALPLLERVAASRTASGAESPQREGLSLAQSWVVAQSAALTSALRQAGQFVGQDLSDYEVEVFSDFHAGEVTPQRLQILLSMRERREIDHETFLVLMRRAMVLHDDDELDNIIRRVRKEKQEEREAAADVAGRRDESRPEQEGLPPRPEQADAELQGGLASTAGAAGDTRE